MVTTSTEQAEQGAEAFALRPSEREVLREVTADFAEQLRDPAARARYGELFAAVEGGAVPPDLLPSLEAMLELVLDTPRLRNGYDVEERHTLARLSARTPRGAAQRAAIAEVNEALTALAGQTVERMAFSPTPGGHGIEIVTDRCRLSLAVDRGGVRVERLDLAG